MGGLSVANILLQVTGDSDDAQRELAAVSRELALFGRETAEAEVDINTASARANLEELEARLSAFSAEDATAEVNVLIAKAQSDIAVLQAELNRIDGEEVTVDVDVRRGIVEKIGSLTREIDKLDGSSSNAAHGGISSFVRGIGDAFEGTRVFGASLSSVAAAAPMMVAGLIQVGGQLLAIVASAASAGLGLGALAIAFLSTLPAGIALAVGAIANFKEEAETVGTAAYALSGNVQDLANVFRDATSGGADALFVGISDAIRDLAPMIEGLGPAFTNLGKAGGDAFRLLGEQFSSPEWGKFFEFTINSLARLTPLFAESFGSFAKILANIATAAMPFLIKGFELLADGLDAVAGKTSDISGLRDVIGGMVGSLGVWGDLVGGLVDLGAALVEAFAPIGDGIVESLAEGAHNLADWLRSGEGLERIHTFFEEVGPLVAQFATLLFNVGKVLLQIGQFFAPLATAILAGLNAIVVVISDWIDWITKLDRALAFKNWGGFFSDLAGAVKGAFSDAAAFVGDLFSKIAGWVATPIDFVLKAPRDVLGVIQDIWATARDKIKVAIEFLLKAPRTVLGVVQDIWASARDKVKQAIDFVLKAPRTVLSAVQDIWGEARDKIKVAIEFLLKVPHDAVGAALDLWGEVRDKIKVAIDFVLNLPAISTMKSLASQIWDAINDALPDISIDIDIPKPHVPGFASGVRSMAEGRLSLVGEQGPELRYVPTGADIYTASETQRILRALAGGASAPLGAGASAPALAGGGGPVVQEFNLSAEVPATGSADPDIALAKWNAALRGRGVLG